MNNVATTTDVCCESSLTRLTINIYSPRQMSFCRWLPLFLSWLLLPRKADLAASPQKLQHNQDAGEERAWSRAGRNIHHRITFLPMYRCREEMQGSSGSKVYLTVLLLFLNKYPKGCALEDSQSSRQNLHNFLTFPERFLLEHALICIIPHMSVESHLVPFRVALISGNSKHQFAITVTLIFFFLMMIEM